MRRKVRFIRFHNGRRELFGKTCPFLRNTDGYDMEVNDLGCILVRNIDGDELLMHIQGCDVYLEREVVDEAKLVPVPSPAAAAAPPEPLPPPCDTVEPPAPPVPKSPTRGKDAPQVR